ncbi:uncharacterized protein Eint_071530 [Encephalitozoon intestinalis ATCC 50506]|uniref:Uncharacterized protein n=1 Tax=Encephalitozoon intestinalis (strain ATCC 50506) TaxID=876142 RepID=E0S877_ENCIT|nr:uncharacterized protein Eint_071530 [Encephalitozoon intestinalis ATCC 50506]ADM11912.1 hypothetical protein Eint_071530 [Encephalitozoon intestinalis ATCC 50506]UTX45668.1 putative geranyltransferase [Encephalitozoon intestinalis]
MRAPNRIGTIRALCLLGIYSHSVALCQEDESTVEIVLLSNGTEKTRPREDDKNDINTEDKSKALRSLLTTLVSHLMAGNKFQNSLLKSYDGGDRSDSPKESGDRQTASPSQNSKANKSPAQEPTTEMLEKIKRVPMGYRTFCSFLQNLDLIRDKLKNKPGTRRIRNVLVYEGYHLTDYWGRLKFRKEGDKLIDETGYFEGVKVNTFEDIIKEGKMTKTGFIQKKEIGETEVNENLITMKLLLNEIAKEKNTSIHGVINEGCNMSIVEELVFYGNSPSAHNDEIVHVCICSDSFCKEPCKDIVPMKMEELEFRG